MPRISAPSIAEHVAQQEAAILDAAARLFAEQGVAGTDLADIAKAVGLARSSLYRYFPDKDHILLRWFDRELEPVIATCEQIVAGGGPVATRLNRWLDFQIDYLAAPEHQIAPKLAREVGAVSPEVQRQIAAGHIRLYRTLATLVDEELETEGGQRRDHSLVVTLVGGLVQAAGQAALDGADPRRVKNELRRSAHAVLTA